jgi:hypothetical protein
MSLKLLQVAMMDFIENKKNDSEDDALFASVSENINERMNIYRNGYRVRLTSLLRQAYPALLRLLGLEAFSALSQDYLRAYPPRTASVFHYGHHLPEFLVAHLGQNDAVVELAELEWVVYRLSRAEKESSLTLSGWKEIIQLGEEESFRFFLVKSASLQAYRFNSVEAWQALIEKKSVPESVSKLSQVLLWRNEGNELIIEQQPVLPGRLLKMLCNGLTLSQCCEALASCYQSEEGVITDISSHLLAWINRGIFRAQLAEG